MEMHVRMEITCTTKYKLYLFSNMLSVIYLVQAWLRQKCYSPQVRPNRGSNLWPPDHGSIFHVHETLTLTAELSGTFSSTTFTYHIHQDQPDQSLNPWPPDHGTFHATYSKECTRTPICTRTIYQYMNTMSKCHRGIYLISLTLTVPVTAIDALQHFETG